VGLIYDLENLLHRKVDVVTAKSLHYFLKDRILQEAVSLRKNQETTYVGSDTITL